MATLRTVETCAQTREGGVLNILAITTDSESSRLVVDDIRSLIPQPDWKMRACWALCFFFGLFFPPFLCVWINRLLLDVSAKRNLKPNSRWHFKMSSQSRFRGLSWNSRHRGWIECVCVCVWGVGGVWEKRGRMVGGQDRVGLWQLAASR